LQLFILPLSTPQELRPANLDSPDARVSFERTRSSSRLGSFQSGTPRPHERLERPLKGSRYAPVLAVVVPDSQGLPWIITFGVPSGCLLLHMVWPSDSDWPQHEAGKSASTYSKLLLYRQPGTFSAVPVDQQYLEKDWTERNTSGSEGGVSGGDLRQANFRNPLGGGAGTRVCYESPVNYRSLVFQWNDYHFRFA
jgi:hypothetical protein